MAVFKKDILLSKYHQRNDFHAVIFSCENEINNTSRVKLLKARMKESCSRPRGNKKSDWPKENSFIILGFSKGNYGSE